MIILFMKMKNKICEKISLNIFNDLFKTINNAHSKTYYGNQFIDNKISKNSNNDNEEAQIKKLKENIITKYNRFLIKYGNNNSNKNLIIPPHKLTEDELNILNTFMDELSFEELENITVLGCNYKFCSTFKLKLSLEKLMK